MKLVDDALYLILGVVALAGALAGVYFMGVSAGKDEVNLAWVTEKKNLGDEIIRLNGKIQDNLAEHSIESSNINKQLRNQKDQHEKAILAIKSDAANRLHSSEKRAGVYQRMSEGAESERRSLASHAAELDRSLEEGRLLVAELQATVRQRDSELISLGSQILTDRKLINATTTPTKAAAQ